MVRIIKKLNRAPKHRIAMVRTMMDQLMQYERIYTTDAKAKVLLPLANRFLYKVFKGNMYSGIHAQSVLRKKETVKKVLTELKQRLKDAKENGELLVTIKNTGLRRKGDKAKLYMVEVKNNNKQITEDNNYKEICELAGLDAITWELKIRTEEAKHYNESMADHLFFIEKNKQLIEEMKNSPQKEVVKIEDIHSFIDTLDYSENLKTEAKKTAERMLKSKNVKLQQKPQDFDAFLKQSQLSYMNHLQVYAKQQLVYMERLNRSTNPNTFNYNKKYLFRYASNLVDKYLTSFQTFNKFSADEKIREKNEKIEEHNHFESKIKSLEISVKEKFEQLQSLAAQGKAKSKKSADLNKKYNEEVQQLHDLKVNRVQVDYKRYQKELGDQELKEEFYYQPEHGEIRKPKRKVTGYASIDEVSKELLKDISESDKEQSDQSSEIFEPMKEQLFINHTKPIIRKRREVLDPKTGVKINKL